MRMNEQQVFSPKVQLVRPDHSCMRMHEMLSWTVSEWITVQVRHAVVV